MAREIKFRAWDDGTKTMLPPQDLSQASRYWTWFGTYDYPLMQFTGFADKKGKEIYEGDFLAVPKGHDFYQTKKRWMDGDMPGLANNPLVEWDGEEGAWRLAWEIDDGDHYHGWHDDFVGMDGTEKLEVIGNIWENTDLLK
jgi:uncharacterized phage protein (TIGR01671 family)